MRQPARPRDLAPDARWIDTLLVIHVKAYTHRRVHLERELARVGLKPEYVLDWDAHEIDPATDARFFAGNQLSSGQKSCALKHVAALRTIAARACTAALVLEDDAVLEDGFLQGLAAGLAETASQPVGAHVLFIGSGGNFYTPKSRQRPGQRVYQADKGRFTDSYVIDAATARRRLAWIDTHRMDGPIDVMFDRMDRELGIVPLWLEPPVVEQGSKNGLFDTSLEPAPARAVQRVKFALEKFRRKVLYQLWR